MTAAEEKSSVGRWPPATTKSTVPAARAAAAAARSFSSHARYAPSGAKWPARSQGKWLSPAFSSGAPGKSVSVLMDTK